MQIQFDIAPLTFHTHLINVKSYSENIVHLYFILSSYISPFEMFTNVKLRTTNVSLPFAHHLDTIQMEKTTKTPQRQPNLSDYNSAAN